MYELRPGAYFGASLNGMAGLGDIPPQYYPTTDAHIQELCQAQGVNPCTITPGWIDFTGGLHVITDVTGQPCTAPIGLGPCAAVRVTTGVDPNLVAQAGISLLPISQDTTTPYAATMNQAQTLALLQLMYGSPATAPVPPAQNPSLQTIGQPPVGNSVQNVYSSPTTAAAVASQIPGATVSQTTTGGYQVVAPGDAVASPSIVASNPIVPTQTPATPSGSSTPPAGNAQATPPSASMFCFPGDTSGEIMSGVPVCQYTAIGAIGLLVLLAVAMK